MLKVLLALSAATSALSAPLERLSRRDIKAYVTDIDIHDSCSTPQRRMIQQGLKEAYEVASFAKDYISTNGASDPVFQLYFGDKPEAFPVALGAYDALLHSNKEGVILRCDDPDQNCKLPGWRGHWRGENATSETVICDASYTDRVFNAAFCMNGFQLATTKPSLYWSIDLIHRLYHVPQIANSAVAHYAEDLGEVIELAEHNSTYSPFDSNAVQYFAAHVYAVEVAKGGDACIGDIAHAHVDASAGAAAPTSSAAAAVATPNTPAAPTAPPAVATGNDCHSHADGSVHCSSH